MPVSAAAAGLRGRALDPEGQPVPGAAILVTRGYEIVAQTTTDSRGEFAIGDLTGDGLLVAASRDGLRAAAVPVDLDGGTEREITLRLEISAISESVIVSAAQVDVPLTRVADSVTAIDAAALEARQIDTLADAMRLVPGVAVSRSGSAGGLTSLFPRGGESDYTLVLIDGVATNAFGGGYDFAHLGSAGVERLEVVRGPQSALYGGGAIGAVVSVVSRRGDPARVDGSIEGGGMDTWRVDGSAAGMHDGWAGSIAAERFESEGFTGSAPATGEVVSNEDYTRHFFTGGGGWHGARGAAVESRVRVAGNERGFPGPYGSNPAGNYGGVDRVSRGMNDELLFSIDGRVPTGERWRHRVLVTFSDLDSEFISIFDPDNPTQSESQRVTARFQSDVDVSVPLGVSVGLEFQREQARSTFITGEISQEIPIDRDIAGYFGEARYTAGRLAATAGVRVEHIRRDALEGDPNAFQPRPTFDEDTVWSTNPRVSALWLLRSPDDSGWTKLRASAGTGIRPPTAFEIAFTDNPGLQPERSVSFDGGIEHAFARGAAVASATFFFNDYDDLIVAVGRSFADASRYRTDNIANARARGLEIAASWRARGVAVSGNYTFLDTEILSVDRAPGQAPSPFEVGDPLIRRPRHQGVVDVTVRRGRLTAFTVGTARGEVLDVEPSFGASGGLFEAPGYLVMSAGASFLITRGVSAYARVANLFDEDYEEAYGFPSPGRTGFIGVRVAVSK
ncbi:MAG TPA: TonB-dependent receptor [Vicinamibacterales bacterium]|nr:TonB-dependent receptor [Vicinamibacterales bacterium]